MSNPRIIFKGDVEASMRLKGQGTLALFRLEERMRTKNLQQLVSRYSPYHGALITVSNVFGIRQIIIETTPGGGEEEIRVVRECLCLPYFALGVVVSVDPPTPIQNIDPDTGEWFAETDEAYEARLLIYTESLTTIRFKYDVDVCVGNRFYRVEDVIDANYGRYFEQQIVLVTAGAPFDSVDDPWGAGRNCLMNAPRFTSMMISPLHITGNLMRKWLFKRVQ